MDAWKWQWPFTQLFGEVDASLSRHRPQPALSPVMEGPEVERKKEGWGQRVKNHLAMAAACVTASSSRHVELPLLLDLMAAPLSPVPPAAAADSLPLPSLKNVPIERSSAQYIVQQYVAASGGAKALGAVRSAYVKGRLTMAVSDFETAAATKSGHSSVPAEVGSFVLWQMHPEMWYFQLAVSNNMVSAGSNGKLVWRYVPWLGVHATTGPARPLRRALQGLDPLATAKMLAPAMCAGEREINGEPCFLLKLSADTRTLKARSEGAVEVIQHTIFGYFSQKTGLLVRLEDSHLTRMQLSTGSEAMYWDTSICSSLGDYRKVDGVMIAHSGCTAVKLYRFGDNAMSHTVAKMEETWTVDEAAFNVPGLSAECFIPPSDLKHDVPRENGKGERIRKSSKGS